MAFNIGNSSNTDPFNTTAFNKDPFGKDNANNLNNHNKKQQDEFALFFNDIASPKPAEKQANQNEFSDIFGSSNNQAPFQLSDTKLQTNSGKQGSLFNEDDIVGTLNDSPTSKKEEVTNDSFDKIFKATSQGQGYSQPRPTFTASYDSKQSNKAIDDQLKGRNLGKEAISNERKLNLFQRYIFNSYKHQDSFNISTEELIRKVLDGLWPFHPENQPDGIVIEYNVFVKKFFPRAKHMPLKQFDIELDQTLQNGEPVHNPFNKPDNDELSFIGRDLESENTFKTAQYKADNNELYGPLWIFVTLLVEFIILGHLTNQLSTNAKSSNNLELFEALSAKTADQSLKRIMKISFLLACFYLGNPFVAYLMFKSKNAIEVSFVQQLCAFAYSYVIFIPGSLILFALQSFSRFKYLMVCLLWILHLYFIHKQIYETRRKYFDFGANKQLAWFLFTSTFIYMWLYKSYFMQV